MQEQNPKANPTAEKESDVRLDLNDSKQEDAPEKEHQSLTKHALSIFEKLDSTQDSIVGASTVFLQSCQKNPSFCPKLILIWKERIQAVDAEKQISFMYLANDLIQRSKIKKIEPEFWKFFQDHLEEVLLRLFNPLETKLDSQQKYDLMKVIDVWRQRTVYPKDFVDQLCNKLQDLSGIDAGLILTSKAKKIKSSDLKPFAERMEKKKIQGVTVVQEMCPQWVALSSQMSQSFDNCSKIQQLDKRISDLLKAETLDATEVECKINEYRETVHQEIEFVKKPLLMSANLDWHGRLENMMLQELVKLEKIEALCDRVNQIEVKLDKTE